MEMFDSIDIDRKDIVLAMFLATVFVVISAFELFSKSKEAECKPLRYVCYGDLTYEHGVATCEAKTTGDAAGGGG